MYIRGKRQFTLAGEGWPLQDPELEGRIWLYEEPKPAGIHSFDKRLLATNKDP